MKAKITENLISFVTIRRGGWILKVSVFKNKHVLVIAMNCFDMKTIVQAFSKHVDAADFIELLVKEH